MKLKKSFCFFHLSPPVAQVTFCDLAFIRFATIDTNSNHIVSQRIIPINSLRPGYRHIRLRSPTNQPLAISSLFIFSSMQEEGIEVTVDQCNPSAGAFDPTSVTSAKATTAVSTIDSPGNSSGQPACHLSSNQLATVVDTSPASGSIDARSLPSKTATSLASTVTPGSSSAPGVSGASASAPGQQQGTGTSITPSSVPTRRRMFFLVVHGVVQDEPSTILKITQDSTASDVIAQALVKGGKRSENAIDYALMEQVTSSWDKKNLLRYGNKAYYSIQRVLEPNERPLEAQSKWKGEGRFVLKKLDDPSTRAWMSTIKAANVLKERKLARQTSEGSSGGSGTSLPIVKSSASSNDKFSSWNDDFLDNFLVCIYNVSPDQPYTILKASTHSTAQEIIQRVRLVKYFFLPLFAWVHFLVEQFSTACAQWMFTSKNCLPFFHLNLPGNETRRSTGTGYTHLGLISFAFSWKVRTFLPLLLRAALFSFWLQMTSPTFTRGLKKA